MSDTYTDTMDIDEEFTQDEHKDKAKMAQDAAAPTKRNGWADLPAELRNAIYKLTLTCDRPIALRGYYDEHNQPSVLQKRGWFWGFNYLTPRPYQKPQLVSNLALIDKATYAEAAPILYQNKDFHFAGCNDLHVFLSRLRPSTIAHITNVTILHLELRPHEWKTGFARPAFNLLAQARNLSSLRIDSLHPWDHSEVKLCAEFLLRNADIWLNAMAMQRGSFQAAAEIVRFNEMCDVCEWAEDVFYRPEDFALYGLSQSGQNRIRNAMVKSFHEYLRIRMAAAAEPLY